jgi:hypothetical protein
MRSKTPPLLILGAVALVGAAGAAWQARSPAAEPATTPASPDRGAQAAPSGAGFAASMYFVDKDGNPRTPTPAEMRDLADALKKDMARIAGPHQGKRYVRTEPSGAIAATVATSKLVFLVATENPDGTISITHADSAGDVLPTPTAAGNAPEM